MGLTFLLLLLLLLLLQILTQKLLKSSSKLPINLFKSSRKQMTKKGGMAGGGKTYSNDGCHLVILDSL